MCLSVLFLDFGWFVSSLALQEPSSSATRAAVEDEEIFVDDDAVESSAEPATKRTRTSSADEVKSEVKSEEESPSQPSGPPQPKARPVSSDPQSGPAASSDSVPQTAEWLRASLDNMLDPVMFLWRN